MGCGLATRPAARRRADGAPCRCCDHGILHRRDGTGCDRPQAFRGNAQKVILARELAKATRCLLCNQPTRGLDVGVIDYVHKELLRKRDEGVAVLLASEELEDLIALSDRIAVIFRGRIMGVIPRGSADVARLGRMMAGASAKDAA